MAIVFTVIIILMVILMVLKWHLFPAILAGAILIGVFSGMNLVDIVRIFADSTFNWDALNFLAMVFLINLLAQILKKVGALNRFASGAEYVLRGSRLGLASLPMFVGLLPMPGGALMTAPMVQEQAKPHHIEPGMLVYINFWFRHVWEYFWPLYPGIILVLAVLKIPYRVFFTNISFVTLGAIAVGMITLFGFVKRRQVRPERVPGKGRKAFKDILFGIFPVLLIMVLIAGIQIPFNFPVSVLMLAVVLATILIYKLPVKKLPGLMGKASKWGVLVMLVAILFFRQILNASTVLGDFKLLLDSASPAAITLLVILLPFLVGLLVGLNQGYVGATFPLLAPFLINDPGHLMLAYVFGFIGCMLSPAHLCLYFSKDYFKADWGSIYKWLLPSAMGLGGIALGAWFLFF